MIVEPDFCDHWKTELLVKRSGSENAVRCLLRFWSHCQSRKKWNFEDMSPAKLACICKWTGDEQVFWDAMLQTFLDQDGQNVSAHEWEQVNHRLIHNWEAGKKGGRPAQPHSEPKKTQGLPEGLTQGVTDRVDREDRSEREIEEPFASLKEAATHFEPEFPELHVKHSLSDMVCKKDWALTESNCRSWLKLERGHRRKAKKAPRAETGERTVGGEGQPISLEEQAELAKQFAKMKLGIRNGAEAAA